MTIPARPHGHLGMRAREVLDNPEQDSLWHCDYCATNQRGQAVFNTLANLEQHAIDGHPAQSEEERQEQMETVKHIDSQVMPEPIPYVAEYGNIIEHSDVRPMESGAGRQVTWINPPPLPEPVSINDGWDDLLALAANPLITDSLLGYIFRAWVKS